MSRALRAEPEAVPGKSASNIGSRTIFAAVMTTRSATVGYAERPGFTRLARLGDVDPPQWLRAIGLCPEAKRPTRRGTTRTPSVPPASIAVMVTPSMPGAPWLVATSPTPPHHVAAGELVVEGMESPWWVPAWHCDRARVGGLERGPQPSAWSDGSSRLLGTHQRPPVFAVHR